MARHQATVLFIEDELSLLHEFKLVLERQGHRVLACSHPDAALKMIREEGCIDIAVSDMKQPMENCKGIGYDESEGGRRAGLVLALELRRKFKRVPVIFWTYSYDRDLRQQILELGNARLVSKASGKGLVLDMIADGLDGFRSGKRPRTFIVHGHDETTMQTVKHYLETELKFPEPVVLRDMPSYGRTIIEKLEAYAYSIDLVFVLLTPDDIVASSGAPDAMRYRSRQNVVFELGYFMGALGRSTGRVILLYRTPIELPSDIGGIISIDITNGFTSADSQIRQEVREWL